MRKWKQKLPKKSYQLQISLERIFLLGGRAGVKERLGIRGKPGVYKLLPTGKTTLLDRGNISGYLTWPEKERAPEILVFLHYGERCRFWPRSWLVSSWSWFGSGSVCQNILTWRDRQTDRLLREGQIIDNYWNFSKDFRGYIFL